MSKKDEDRAQRLADALRLNLRRRKAQARGDGAEPADSERDGGNGQSDDPGT